MTVCILSICRLQLWTKTMYIFALMHHIFKEAIIFKKCKFFAGIEIAHFVNADLMLCEISIISRRYAFPHSLFKLLKLSHRAALMRTRWRFLARHAPPSECYYTIAELCGWRLDCMILLITGLPRCDYSWVQCAITSLLAGETNRRLKILIRARLHHVNKLHILLYSKSRAPCLWVACPDACKQVRRWSYHQRTGFFI